MLSIPPAPTDRLHFRWWKQNDLPLAMALWGDLKVTRLIDARGALNEEAVKARLDDEIATAKTHGVQYWPIFLRKGGDHIGCCGLRPYDLDENIYELGVHLCATAWGRGYATEASRAAITHAFENLGARALFAGHNPQNTASRGLLLKLGFVWTHDEHYEPTGLQHPSYRLERPCP